MQVHLNTGENAENGIPGGWVKELSSAKAAAAKDKSAASNLRCARAALKLRQFDKVAEYCKIGLGFSGTQKERTELEKLSRVAAKDLSEAQAEGFEAIKQGLLERVFEEGMAVEDCQLVHHEMVYTNLNFLQTATMMGNPRLLELAVAVGAALDDVVQADRTLPAGNGVPSMKPSRAPGGVTALALACGCLAAMNKGNYAHIVPNNPGTLEKLSKCCVLLVMLGADCSARLDFTFPTNFLEKFSSGTSISQDSGLMMMWQILGLKGKTVKELALETGSEELIKAVEIVSTKEGALRHVFCRCGSRLPWAECHAGQMYDSICAEIADCSSPTGCRLHWRYSPLAKCGCNRTAKKLHYKCCWNSTERIFQNDTNGQLIKHLTGSLGTVSGADRELMKSWLEYRRIESRGAEDALLFPERDENGRAIEGKQVSAETHKRLSIEFIKEHGIDRNDLPYVTKCHQWQRDVLAGTMENLERFFCWIELHWMVPKSELVLRTKEWNEALEKYCDKAGLHGECRSKVIELHKAEPFAPCGNSSCSNREHKIKGFKACSRCKSIAYCSKNCQRIHWKNKHKIECIQY